MATLKTIVGVIGIALIVSNYIIYVCDNFATIGLDRNMFQKSL